MASAVPLLAAVQDISAGNTKIPQSEFLPVGSLAIVDQGQTLIAGWTDEDSTAVRTEGPVIVFGDHTRAFKYVDFPFAMGADGVKVLRVRGGFDTKFVYRYLRSQTIPSAGYSRHFKFLKEISVPKPSLEEQRRIAAILDQADALRAKRRQVLAHLDVLTQSIFYGLFGDPVHNERGWPTCKLAELGALDRGVSKRRPRNDPALLGGAYPLIQTGDVANSGGYITGFTATYSDLGLAQSKLWPAGTLCITIAANIAKTGVLTFDACFPDSVVGFTSDPATTTYVRIWLGFLQARLEASAPQSAQKNINLALLRSLDVPTPDRGSLADFAARIEHAHAQLSTMRRGLAADDELFSSLQFRAFRGEL